MQGMNNNKDQNITFKYLYFLLPEREIDEPPLFLVCAKDDSQCWDLIEKWCKNKSSFEYLRDAIQIRNKLKCFPELISEVIHGVLR